MKWTCSLLLFLLLIVLYPVLLLGVGPARAGDEDSVPNSTPVAIIPIPGLRSFDISWVDEPTQTYYFADRTHAAVQIIDARANTVVNQAVGFVGFRGSNDVSGPDGVVVIQSAHELWAGDGDSTVKVFDLKSDSTPLVASHVIPTGGFFRADEMAFDPKDHLIVVANNADNPPFLSFISTETYQKVGQIDFPCGTEQSVWDPATRKIYLSIPGCTAADGAIAEIDPLTHEVTMHSIAPCDPSGLALGLFQNLVVGCATAQQTVIWNARTKSVVTRIEQVGRSDEVWFNRGDGNYYIAARQNATGPALGVIDAATNTWLANVPTPVGANAHSVAADRANNHIFVPMAAAATNTVCPTGCVAVFSSEE
jgi:DNA-binding beta-propeller fold protein YncE